MRYLTNRARPWESIFYFLFLCHYMKLKERNSRSCLESWNSLLVGHWHGIVIWVFLQHLHSAQSRYYHRPGQTWSLLFLQTQSWGNHSFDNSRSHHWAWKKKKTDKCDYQKLGRYKNWNLQHSTKHRFCSPTPHLGQNPANFIPYCMQVSSVSLTGLALK